MPSSASTPGIARLHRLIVTRPEREGAPWVDALQAAGWPAQSLPLIEVAEPGDPATLAALHRWRQDWPGMDALMFVSAAAVQHFFEGVKPSDASFRTHTRFWAPGPGTARALAQSLKRLGLAADRIDAPAHDAAQFDSEALWPVVQPQLRPGHQLLIVRGQSGDALPSAGPSPLEPPLPGQGRDWLIHQCQSAGVQVQACVAYERRAPVCSATARGLLMAAQGPGSVWLFSSSEALDHLFAWAPEARWTQATAVATHPRIAQRAHDAGFGSVVQTRPALPDVLRTLESHWSLS